MSRAVKPVVPTSNTAKYYVGQEVARAPHYIIKITESVDPANSSGHLTIGTAEMAAQKIESDDMLQCDNIAEYNNKVGQTVEVDRVSGVLICVLANDPTRKEIKSGQLVLGKQAQFKLYEQKQAQAAQAAQEAAIAQAAQGAAIAQAEAQMQEKGMVPVTMEISNIKIYIVIDTSAEAHARAQKFSGQMNGQGGAVTEIMSTINIKKYGVGNYVTGLGQKGNITGIVMAIMPTTAFATVSGGFFVIDTSRAAQDLVTAKVKTQLLSIYAGHMLKSKFKSFTYISFKGKSWREIASGIAEKVATAEEECGGSDKTLKKILTDSDPIYNEIRGALIDEILLRGVGSSKYILKNTSQLARMIPNLMKVMSQQPAASGGGAVAAGGTAAAAGGGGAVAAGGTAAAAGGAAAADSTRVENACYSRVYQKLIHNKHISQNSLEASIKSLLTLDMESGKTSEYNDLITLVVRGLEAEIIVVLPNDHSAPGGAVITKLLFKTPEAKNKFEQAARAAAEAAAAATEESDDGDERWIATRKLYAPRRFGNELQNSFAIVRRATAEGAAAPAAAAPAPAPAPAPAAAQQQGGTADDAPPLPPRAATPLGGSAAAAAGIASSAAAAAGIAGSGAAADEAEKVTI